LRPRLAPGLPLSVAADDRDFSSAYVPERLAAIAWSYCARPAVVTGPHRTAVGRTAVD